MSIYSAVSTNKYRTLAFMVGFSVFVLFFAWILGEASGIPGSISAFFAMVLSLFANAVSFFWGDKLILAMSQARPADRKRDFDFYTITENLCIASGTPLPKLYVIDDTAMNAFATGRDPQHAVVVATTGILKRLERTELEGVIAHELSHIRNFDIRLMLIVTVLVGTVTYMADWFLRGLWRVSDDSDSKGSGIILVIGLVLALFSPIFASIIQLAISREREYLADASGALLTRYPEGLARALEKLNGDREVLEAATNATAHLYITNPFKGKAFSAWFSGLFNTHPPIADRVKRLRKM